MRLPKSSVIALFAFIFCLIPKQGHAQAGKGTITGTVKDSAGNVLIGAVIEVAPSGQRAVSDDQGNFRIPDVSAGTATLTVSYVGFANFTGTANVDASQTATMNAVLQVASRTDQVMVTAERLEGEAEAVNIERSSDDIVQVLPLKVITSLPNTNIADAVGRAPSVSLERDEGEGKYVQIRGTEPRLNNVTINGVNVPSVEGLVRNIKLDSVPADLVERIEVFKTLSANQDADGVGGTVNLVTKTPADKLGYEIGGEGGYTPIQGGRTLGELDGTIGQRFGARKQLGLLLTGTVDRNNRGINDMEPTQAIGTNPATGKNIALISSEDWRSYAYYRTRYGFTPEIDYTFKPGTSAYVKGFYSDFHDYGDTWVYTPNSGNVIDSVNGSQITFDPCNEPTPPANCTPGFMQYRHYIRRPDQQIFSVLTGLRQDLGSTLIVWEVAGSRGHNIGGQDFQTTSFNGPNVNVNLDLSDPLRPRFTPADAASTSAIYDPTLYTVSKTNFTSYIATQLNFQGAVSVARRYNAHSHFGTFEAGLKIRDSQTTQNQNDQFYVPSGATGPFTLAQVQGTYTNPTYYDGYFKVGSLGYGPTSDYNNIIRQDLANIGGSNPGFVLDQVTSVTRSAGAFFNADERVYAGYLMNAISFGKLRLQTGVRFEDTTTNFLANKLVANQDSSGNPLLPTITPVTQSSSYFNALPSIQAQYLIQKNTNLRANFSMGISRPNIGDEVPTTSVDPNASPKSITIGNAALKATRANNYDVLVEHFFQPLGILQAGFFYKQLTNPIYATARFLPSTDPNFPGYLEAQAINGPNAHIAGFEADWEQRFSFLPGLANGLGIAANYSYTTSQATFPSGFSCNGSICRTDQPTLQRTAPNNWNVGLTYDKARFSMRFAVSHNDASIFQYAFVANSTPNDPILGLRGPTGDVYLYAHTQFDIQGSYRLYRGLSFIASGLNLTNEAFGFYQGSPNYPIQREFYKPTVSFGLRYTSSAETPIP